MKRTVFSSSLDELVCFVFFTTSETKADISIVQLDVSEDTLMLRKVIKFLEALEAKRQKRAEYKRIAERGDKIFFWFYFIVATLYVSAMTCVMVKYKCKINHFGFWY